MSYGETIGLESRPMIQCTGLEKSYHRRQVLDNVTFTLSKEKVLLVVGPNGSGKSTLVKLLSGVLRPTKGEILIDGHNVVREYERTRRMISCVWNEATLYPTMQAIKNIEFFAKLNGVNWDDVKGRAVDLLREFGILSQRHIFVANMSSGVQRKVDLCRALLNDSNLLLLDEPTTFLDNRSKKYLVRLLSNYKKSGKTLVIVTHHASLFSEIADEILVLRNGKLVHHGHVSDLLNDVSRRAIILKTSDRLLANKVLLELPEVTGTYVSQRAVHATLGEEADLYAIMSRLAAQGLRISKVVEKGHNIDKSVQEMINAN